MRGSTPYVRKLILPVAGMGTRLMPLTLTTPKNLLTIDGKTLLEHTLDEAKGSSIKEVVIVLSPQHEGAFKDFIGSIGKKYPKFVFHIRVQHKPFGHGHAVLQARGLIKNEPLAIRFPDDIFYYEKRSALASMIRLYGKHKSSVVALERVPQEEVFRWGVVNARPLREHKEMYRIFGVVEKPKVDEAPSNLAIVGAYVISPEAYKGLVRLGRFAPSVNDALLMHHCLIEELAGGGTVLGWEFPCMRLDCGTLESFTRTGKFFSSLKSDRKRQNRKGSDSLGELTTK